LTGWSGSLGKTHYFPWRVWTNSPRHSSSCFLSTRGRERRESWRDHRQCEQSFNDAAPSAWRRGGRGLRTGYMDGTGTDRQGRTAHSTESRPQTTGGGRIPRALALGDPHTRDGNGHGTESPSTLQKRATPKLPLLPPPSRPCRRRSSASQRTQSVARQVSSRSSPPAASTSTAVSFETLLAAAAWFVLHDAW